MGFISNFHLLSMGRKRKMNMKMFRLHDMTFLVLKVKVKKIFILEEQSC